VCRGDSFRPEYKRVAGLRSLLQCPCLVLSATVTDVIFADHGASTESQNCTHGSWKAWSKMHMPITSAWLSCTMRTCRRTCCITTMADFKQPNSTMHVVVSTVAYGMGIEIPDIQQVVHWGRLSSLMTYWQEVGRAGRYGASARAVWYATSAAAGNDAVLKRLYPDTACLRLTILNGS